MNFDSLIARYSRDFELLPPAAGTYEAGRYVETARTPIAKRGAIIGIPERKLFEPGGHYTANDLYLYVSGPLAGERLQVRFRGHIYEVEETRDSSEFAGFCKYLLRWQSLGDVN